MSAGLVGSLIADFLISLVIAMIIVYSCRRVRNQKMVYGIAAVVPVVISFTGNVGRPLYAPLISIGATFIVLHLDYRRGVKARAKAAAAN